MDLLPLLHLLLAPQVQSVVLIISFIIIIIIIIIIIVVVVLVVVIVTIIVIIIIIITSYNGKSNYNYFTLYKASSLNLKKGSAFSSFFSATYLYDEVTVRGCPL